jgi:hypothetical protein
MDTGQAKATMSRRGFFQGARKGAAAAAAVTALAGAAGPGAAKAEEAKRPAVGYRETDHVRRAYALSRF